MTAFEVVLTESGGVTVLTPWVTNLSFRSVDPGGFGSATFDLSRAIDAHDFEEQADVAIYSAETGECVGGGRIVNPGRGVSRSGDVWNISLLGEGVAHMQERKEPYLLVDQRLDPWYQTAADESEMTWAQGGPPNPTSPASVLGTQGWVLRVEEGGVLTTGDSADITYNDIAQFPDTYIGGYGYRHSGGATTSNHTIKVSTDNFATTDESDTFVLGGATVSEDVASVASPRTEITVRYDYVGGGFTADTKTWAYVLKLYVIAMRRDRNGDWIDTGSAYLGLSGGAPTTDEVVTDVWARFCPRFDLSSARVDVSTYEHQDLVWPDGITPLDVLAVVKTADPGHTWAVWEKQTNGLFRTEWRAYDTDVRYEMTAEDGFTETSAATKYVKIFNATSEAATDNRYFVYSHEDPDAALAARGIFPTTTVAGITGDADLEAMLNESELEAGTAQVTVGRKVFDHFTGRWVEPSQVLPGYLCRIAGVNPQPDWLNVNQVPGAAVFKVVSNDYSVSSASSRLELNAYTVDERRAIANMLAAQR